MEQAVPFSPVGFQGVSFAVFKVLFSSRETFLSFVCFEGTIFLRSREVAHFILFPLPIFYGSNHAHLKEKPAHSRDAVGKEQCLDSGRAVCNLLGFHTQETGRRVPVVFIK